MKNQIPLILVSALAFVLWFWIRQNTPNWLNSSGIAGIDYIILFVIAINLIAIVSSYKREYSIGWISLLGSYIGLGSMLFVFSANEGTQAFTSRLWYLLDKTESSIEYEASINTFSGVIIGMVIITILIEIVFFKKLLAFR